jgi:ATP-dependent Clp protease ATP-binding subunit ClpC
MLLRNSWNVTERLKQVMALAERSALAHGHDAVSPAHLALGLIDEGEGLATTALQYHGFSLASVREDVEHLLGSPGNAATTPRSLELTHDAQAVVAVAQSEATTLGHSYLGTEHLLLGLLADPETPIAQLLTVRGFSVTEARARIQWILESDTHNPSPYIPPKAI